MTGGAGLSRRALLAGLCGAAVATSVGCAPASRGVLAQPEPLSSRTPRTAASLAEAEALVQRLSAALAAPDPAGWAGLLGGSDQALWSQVHAGLHAVPQASVGLELQQGIVESSLRADGELTFSAAGVLRHQIAGVDALPVVQHVLLGLRKADRTAALELASIAYGDHQPYQPWEMAPLTALVTDHVVLQFRTGDDAAARGRADEVEHGVARAYEAIPGHKAQPKLSYLWGWDGVDKVTNGRALYGRASLEHAAGVTYRAATTDLSAPARRIILLPPAFASDLERVSAHEATHALAHTFGEGDNGYPFLEEGYASWVEFLDQGYRPKWSVLTDLIDQAVKTDFWGSRFYKDDAGKHYSLAWSFFIWVAERGGRAKAHELSRVFHQTKRAEDVFAPVLGADMKTTIGEWAAWARAQ